MVEIKFVNGQQPLYKSAQPCAFDFAAGDGSISCCQLFDGVTAMIMRLEMHAFTEKRTKNDTLEINFCSNGRFESSFSARDHVILKPGDMAVSCFDGVHGRESESRFPLGYYEGICIEVNPAAAQLWIQRNAAQFAIDFAAMKENLLGEKWFIAGSAGPRCEHVFRELHESISRFDLRFLQLKCIELFMQLSAIPRPETDSVYCSAKQIELIRHLRDHLLTDLNNYVSLAQLSEEHGISVSHLQKLFKQVYGVPVYRYIKEYRLEQAAVELVRSSKRITEIALDAGYDNASKFSECFRKRYGISPTEYRSKHVRRQNGALESKRDSGVPG